ncbi:helix-hairpin-helix domain-containing protein [Halpernia frigidisoli]|uniref:Helix-hairpin-helix motif-containing protein n=1 Tax=Halpernia frigidisoli TaxID=1125876 RepID=A0A1I3E492_9FLAO|nr:helix-hairpin-helix domain-containing protein [Halpernia frigidisoli]SFH93807.1 Helix-hairpin-helix motif-containing protein [Halpernia frigidisoli]
MRSNLPQKLFRKNLWVILILVSCIVSAKIYTKFFVKSENPDFSKIQFLKIKENLPELKIKDFDPNLLSLEQWQKLGLSEKQAETILKYKQIVGGEFKSQDQLQKCYSISAEKFEQIQPFILLPKSSKSSDAFAKNKWEKKEIKVNKKFNPDSYSQKDWENLGFSEKQSAGILKYKNYLGGSFVSKEKLKECYMINEENFVKLSYYLILPEKTPSDFNPYKSKFAKEKIKIKYQNFDPNLLDSKGWMALGFSEKQVLNILNYKERYLKGSFKTLEDISKCYMISPEKFEEMKPFIKLNPQNIIAKNTSISQVQISTPRTDFSKIDLNKINFQQLKEYGFTDRAAGSFLGFRKKLNGFTSKDQILKTYNIDIELTKKLLEIAQLKPVE